MITPNSTATITHRIEVNDLMAFEAGDKVTVERVSPHPQRPDHKYVVFSTRLQQRFQLSDNDLREEKQVAPSQANSNQQSLGSSEQSMPPVASAIESEVYWQTVFGADAAKRRSRETAEAKKMRRLPWIADVALRIVEREPGGSDVGSIFGFALGVGVAGTVLFLVASHFFYLSVMGENINDPVPSLIWGVIILLAVVIPLCVFVGIRSGRYGIMSGVIVAGVLLISQYLLGLRHTGVISAIRETGALPDLWLILGSVLLLAAGAVGGWVGEQMANNERVSDTAFYKIGLVVFGVVTLVVITVSVVGVVKNYQKKALAGKLAPAFEAMDQAEGWQMSAYNYEDEKRDVFLYQKDSGYRLHVVVSSISTNNQPAVPNYENYVVSTSGEVSELIGSSILEKKSNHLPALFDEEQMKTFRVSDIEEKSYDGQKALCYKLTEGTLNLSLYLSVHHDYGIYNLGDEINVWTTLDGSKVLAITTSRESKRCNTYKFTSVGENVIDNTPGAIPL